MEDPEVPLEAAQEHINHHAEHAEGRKWVLGVALSAAVFAAFAAVASLLAGHHVNEALISRIDGNDKVVKASDQWSLYQAKGVKAAVLASKIDLLKQLEKAPGDKDESNLARYEKEQEDIRAKAEGFEHEAETLKEEGERHLGWHVILARSVTMFQISIAIAAVSVLVGRRTFWFVSLGFAALGIYFLGQQLTAEFLVK